MKGFFACIVTLLTLSGSMACNNANNQNAETPIATSLSDAQFVSIEHPDTFLLKIKGDRPLIIPGEAIGRLEVGAVTDSLEKLGRPDKGDAGMCKSLSRWFYGDSTLSPKKQLDVFAACDPEDDMRPHLKWIRTTDPLFRTEKGIGVGSTLKEIKENFSPLVPFADYTAVGDSAKMQMLSAKSRGITFEMAVEADTCRAIVVYASRERMPALYFSFYPDLKYTDQQQ